MIRYFVISVIVLFQSSTYILFAQNNIEVPKGRIENFKFSESKIYPGTEREVTIYIPAQINASIPACVYIQQDGFNPELKFDSIFNELIANKEMPITVGVFIKSGSLPPPNTTTIFRPNRDFEYDVVGDKYSRFVLEEILPLVAAKYNLNLSNNGNDRCIGGNSSGGICAFNAAWERPDAFSRVYCSSGSFVAFKGGHEFPTLIRKSEAKPIRAFLSAGTNDMENSAGDWTLANMEMDKALKFSGYDYKFSIKEGRHGAGWRVLFADGMRYLWKDWPSPINPGSSAPRVNDIIISQESWQLVDQGYFYAQGPACNSKGEVYFIDVSKNKMFRIEVDGNIKEFQANSDQCNSISIGLKDEIYTASTKTGKIMIYRADGKGSIYANDIFGQYVLAMPNGDLYVTTASSNNETGKIWNIKNKTKQVVDTGLKNPTGIALSPDQWLLAVADGNSHFVYSYEVKTDGSLINKEPYFWLHVQDWADDSGAESVCYDKEGHLYVATRYGIQVCTWDGPTQVILPLPNNNRVTGLCFGGSDLNILYAFCGDKIYKRKIKNHGIGAFTPWMKMNKGKL